jgi:uncharacterized protein YndB with AHSA1/START domain
MMTAGLKVTTPTDVQIVMTRSFAAPRSRVWRAMTTPDLVRRWMFTPPGWSWATCEMDVRVGGAYCWAWNGPDGRIALTIRGTHTEVVAPARLVHTERMEMGPGAGACGGDDCCDAEPWELTATLDLKESGGRTDFTMTLRFPSKAARDAALASGMEQGVSAGYDALDRLLATMRG